MKPKQKAKWAAVRAKGKTRFVLLGGSAVLWSAGGLCFGFAMCWVQERADKKAIGEDEAS